MATPSSTGPRSDSSVLPARGLRRRWLAGGAAALVVARAGGVRAQGQAPAEGPASGGQPASRPGRDLPLPAIGSRLALPPLVLLDGSTLDADARRGKATVVYWWASWCPFCAEQSPLMEALWRRHREDGLLVLGVSIDRSAEIAAAHLKRKGYTFPSTWLSPALAPLLPKPKGLPVTVVIGADDRVLAAESGQLFDEDVAALAVHRGR